MIIDCIRIRLLYYIYKEKITKISKTENQSSKSGSKYFNTMVLKDQIFDPSSSVRKFLKMPFSTHKSGLFSICPPIHAINRVFGPVVGT